MISRQKSEDFSSAAFCLTHATYMNLAQTTDSRRDRLLLSSTPCSTNSEADFTLVKLVVKDKEQRKGRMLHSVLCSHRCTSAL
ncbi:hypothetical protein C0Q70_07023 [Pomacea canaliculata]|uniref:Uncharacterized protein n=1 Tax=Pomacea canaliculata TaxID=400727 RepID=A0A2T7PDX9_POMCA|nr:hypothetical protein C0Q70_07023 [Pomacea canaliculata]